MHLDVENIAQSYSILLTTLTEPKKGVCPFFWILQPLTYICISMYTFQTDDWVISLKQYEESVVAIEDSLTDETGKE